MLDIEARIAIRSEIARGNPLTMLVRLRSTRDPNYLEVCAFVLACLRAARAVPPGKPCGFVVSYIRYQGVTITCNDQPDGGRDWIQEQGSAVRHPDPLQPDTAPVAAKISGSVCSPWQREER
jgi:hypothetical protein